MPNWPPAAVSDADLLKLPGLAVDVYHINIGTGDAAIYYLVQYPPSPGPSDKPFIHRACLIDGGTTDGAPEIADFLDNTVAEIYSFAQSNGGRTDLKFPPFDSIVITHWDNDHYGGGSRGINCPFLDTDHRKGVLRLITKHIEDIWEANYPLPKGLNKDEHAEERLIWVKKYQSPYMKYSDPGNDGWRGDTAQTVLYIPYWGAMGRCKFPGELFSTETGKSNGRFWPYYDRDHGEPLDGDVPHDLDKHVDWNMQPTSTRKLLDGRRDEWWAQKLCILRSGAKNILGASLFTSWRMSYEEALKMKNPCHVAYAHKTQKTTNLKADSDLEAKVPFLIIVGVNFECCGDKARNDVANEIDKVKLGLHGLPLDSLDPEPQGELEEEIMAAYKDIQRPSIPGFQPFSDVRKPAVSLSKDADLSLPAKDLSLADSEDVHASSIEADNEDLLPAESQEKMKIPHASTIARLPSDLSRQSGLIDEDELFEGKKIQVIDEPLTNDEAKQTNAVSITTMVAWTNGQISHFAAGDAQWGSEMKFVCWVHFGDNPFRCARTVKLQHHGAADSSPTELFRYLRPRTMVVSCCTNMHTHPRPEVVLWLYAWFAATKAARVVLKTDFLGGLSPSGFGILQSTSYPYYLAQSGTGYVKTGNAPSLAAFDEHPTSEPVKAYQKSLTRFTALLTESFLTTIQEAGPHAGDIEDAVYDQVARIWSSISRQVKSTRPQTSGAADGLTHVIYNDNQKVNYIKVYCRPWHKDLRKLTGFFMDGFAETALKAHSPAAQQASVKKKSRQHFPQDERCGPLQKIKVAIEKFKPIHSMRNRYKEWCKLIDKRRELSSDDYDTEFWNEKRDKKNMPNMDDKDYDFGFMYTIKKQKKDPPTKVLDLESIHLDALSQADASPPQRSQHLVVDSTQAVKPFDSTTVHFVPSGFVAQWSALLENNGTVSVKGLADADDYTALMLFSDYPALTVDPPQNTLTLTDPLRHWLLTAVSADINDATNVVTLGIKETGIENMSIAFKTTIASGNNHAMTFTTTSISTNFATTLDTKVVTLPASGVFVSEAMLTMGLIVEQPDKWKVADVLSYYGMVPDDTATLLDDLVSSGHGELTLRKGMIWYHPMQNKSITQRMEWELDPDVVHSWLGWLQLTSKPVKCSIVGKRKCHQVDTGQGWSMLKETNFIVVCELELPIGNNEASMSGIKAAIDFDLSTGGDSFTVSLNFGSQVAGVSTSSENTVLFYNVLKWLFSKALKGLSQLDVEVSDTDLEPVKDCLPNANLASIRRLEITCYCPEVSKISVQSFQADIEINPGWKDANNDPVLFQLTYGWRAHVKYPHSLKAQVWFSIPPTRRTPPQVMPRFEPSQVAYPSVITKKSLSLLTLMPGGDWKLPVELDLCVTRLVLLVKNRTISISGQLQAAVIDPGHPINTSSLGILLTTADLSASYTRDDHHQPDASSYAIMLAVRIVLPKLRGAPEKFVDESDRTAIEGAIRFTNTGGQKQLALYGSVQFLNLGQLASFFSLEDSSPVMDLLGHIEIQGLHLTYNYDVSSGHATDFTVEAQLLLGPVNLALTFNRNQKKVDFVATLQLSDQVKNASLGNIVAALLGENEKTGELVNSIPAFITGINLQKAKLTLNVHCVPNVTGSTPKPGSVTIALQLDVPIPGGSNFQVAFVQIVEKVLPAGKTIEADPPPAPPNAKTRTKRLIRANVADLPWGSIPKPPVVDKLAPAFDQLGVYWVQDSVAAKGFTKADVDLVSTVADIHYKTKPGSKPDPTAIVLSAGWHFMVLDSGGQGAQKVILDYAFNKPKQFARSKTTRGNDYPSLFGVPVSEGDGDGTATQSLEKTIGPLKIKNVGLRFEKGSLMVLCDILAHLGPIELLLSGFGFKLDLSKASLKDISTLVPSLMLAGMGISFDRPPVALAGLFIDQSDANSRMYAGGVALTLKPYSFMAVGAYGEIKKSGGMDWWSMAKASAQDETFRTVFVFAKLNGPLIELGWASIGGISLGFGYNSSIKYPTIETVHDFPFISNTASGSGGNSLAVMQKLTSKDPKVGVVSPKDGSYWLAAGIEMKAFQVLDVSAVLIIEFNPYVSLGIFARAVAQMPPVPTPRTACFAYVELGIAATCDFQTGALCLRVQISPNSFVLSPFCHLTGDIAVCNWFGNNPHAGDFVFSIGGYHPAFDRPAHYPQLQRLAITWSVSNNLTVRGEAYFAVTPKAVMGGGALNAVFDMGSLHAWFCAHADFLMTFHPFHMIADVGVDVGVQYDLELLFITVHLKIHCGADVHLEGPPFGGYAVVHFSVFSFKVPFGNQSRIPSPLSLNEFRDFLFQVPDGKAPASTEASISKLHTLSVESGRYTGKQSDVEVKKGEPWMVNRGGFVFRIESRVPLQQISQPAFEKVPKSGVSHPELFFGIPMHLQNPLSSNMTVSIQKITDNITQDQEFRVTDKLIKAMPLSIWKKYDPNNTPGTGNNNVRSVLDSSPGSVNLMMGASFAGPASRHSFDNIKAFDTAAAASFDIFSDDKRPLLPAPARATDAAWQAAPPIGTGKPFWDSVVQKWQNPELVLDSKFAGSPDTTGKETEDGADVGQLGEPPPPPPPPPPRAQQAVVKHVIDDWTTLFGWSAWNALRNEVSFADGEDPLVWKQFDGLYMAAPMISAAV